MEKRIFLIFSILLCSAFLFQDFLKKETPKEVSKLRDFSFDEIKADSPNWKIIELVKLAERIGYAKIYAGTDFQKKLDFEDAHGRSFEIQYTIKDSVYLEATVWEVSMKHLVLGDKTDSCINFSADLTRSSFIQNGMNIYNGYFLLKYEKEKLPLFEKNVYALVDKLLLILNSPKDLKFKPIN
ncbi:MAG: hypothetical protein KC516_02055 [Nanoarchaeota archaeon]|nr:hypothetical protein [Nanoarchaeota archaeon]